MFEPLVISKSVFDSLTKEQQQAVIEAGASLEKFAMDAAKVDDVRMAEVYAKNGAKVYDMDDATFAKWRADRAADRVGGLREEREGRQALARHGDGREVTPAP